MIGYTKEAIYERTKIETSPLGASTSALYYAFTSCSRLDTGWINALFIVHMHKHGGALINSCVGG